MTKALLTLMSAAGLALTLSAPAALAGAAPEEAMAMLSERGYTDIEVATGDAPGYLAWGCKNGTHFAIKLDPDNNIVDVDPLGPCGTELARRDGAPAGGWKDAGPEDRAYGYAPTPAFIDRLLSKGFYDIRVVDEDDDEVEVLACKGGGLYEIEIEHGRIDDVDRKGRCGVRRRSRVDVDAPYAGVQVDDGEVKVEAPFTGVHVGKDGVHVRAPFVDLHVPK